MKSQKFNAFSTHKYIEWVGKKATGAYYSTIITKEGKINQNERISGTKWSS